MTAICVAIGIALIWTCGCAYGFQMAEENQK